MKTILTIFLISVSSFLFSQDISGLYLINGKMNAKLRITHVKDNIYTVDSRDEKWQGAGILHENTLMLIYKYDNVKKGNYRGSTSIERKF